MGLFFSPATPGELGGIQYANKDKGYEEFQTSGLGYPHSQVSTKRSHTFSAERRKHPHAERERERERDTMRKKKRQKSRETGDQWL